MAAFIPSNTDVIVVFTLLQRGNLAFDLGLDVPNEHSATHDTFDKLNIPRAAINPFMQLPSEQSDPIMAQFLYLTHRGNVEEKTVTISKVWFGSTEFYKEPQWLLCGIDYHKKEERNYAVKDIRSWWLVDTKEKTAIVDIPNIVAYIIGNAKAFFIGTSDADVRQFIYDKWTSGEIGGIGEPLKGYGDMRLKTFRLDYVHNPTRPPGSVDVYCNKVAVICLSRVPSNITVLTPSVDKSHYVGNVDVVKQPLV